MNHSELQEKLFDWHDRRLSPAAADEVQSHFSACLECQTQLESWRQTAHAFLTPLQQTEDEQIFTQQVMRRIRVAQADAQARPRFFSRWAFPALALSMGSFAAVFLYVSQPTTASADGLFLSDQQPTSSEWVASVAKEDPLFESVVEKP